jgi:hypothetical protein
VKNVIPKLNKGNLRKTTSFDYWWGVIFGGILTALILIPSGNLILKKCNLDIWFYPYSAICLILITYYQWRDENLTEIRTGLSRSENLQVITTSLERLKWEYSITPSKVDLTLNKYILGFVEPTIIPGYENIQINFKYRSTFKTGRLPFFFGVSNFLKWKFIRTIEKVLIQEVN